MQKVPFLQIASCKSPKKRQKFDKKRNSEKFLVPKYSKILPKKFQKNFGEGQVDVYNAPFVGGVRGVNLVKCYYIDNKIKLLCFR